MAQGGADIRTEASMCKVFVSERCFEIADKAVQIHGNVGVTRNHPVEFIFRRLRMWRIVTGTSEIQRNTIAKGILNWLRILEPVSVSILVRAGRRASAVPSAPAHAPPRRLAAACQRDQAEARVDGHHRPHVQFDEIRRGSPDGQQHRVAVGRGGDRPGAAGRQRPARGGVRRP
jgi:hypothetical protein